MKQRPADDSFDDRALTKRRVIARGSEPPQAPEASPSLVRTRAAKVMKGSSPPANAAVVTTKKPERAATETVIVDEPSMTSPTKPMRGPRAMFASAPTRRVSARSLFALIGPDDAYEEVAVARRETHRTRRMQIEDITLGDASEGVAQPRRISVLEVGVDGRPTGERPLVDWTPARTPSIDTTPVANAPADTTRGTYRRGMLMGAAVATFIATSVAAALALLI